VNKGKASEKLIWFISNTPGWFSSPVSTIDRNPDRGFICEKRRRD
jgi:hypothetical protein